MKVVFKATNIKLDPALKDFIEEKINDLEKFSKIFQKNYFNGYSGRGKPRVEAWMEVERRGPFFRAECQMHFPETSIRAEAVSKNLKLAIIEIKNELQRQLKQYKEKISAKIKRKLRALKKELHLSPQARFYRKGRIREERI